MARLKTEKVIYFYTLQFFDWVQERDIETQKKMANVVGMDNEFKEDLYLTETGCTVEVNSNSKREQSLEKLREIPKEKYTDVLVFLEQFSGLKTLHAARASQGRLKLP